MKLKKRYLTIVAALLMLASPDSPAQSLPYGPGENLTFSINYRWAFRSDIATVDLTLREAPDGDGVLHAAANLSTRKFFDSFYKIRDLYECKFKNDVQVTPLWYHRDVHEGSYWAKGTYTWSEDALSLHAIIDKSTRPHRDTTYRENQVIHDIINLLYFVRAANVGPQMPVVSRYLIVDRDVMEIRARYIADETKMLGGDYGTYRTRKIGIAMRSVTPPDDTNNIGLVLSSEWPEGKFGEESVFLWLSDDANRLPVFFTAPLRIGSINGVLTGYSGNRYEVFSKFITD